MKMFRKAQRHSAGVVVPPSLVSGQAEFLFLGASCCVVDVEQLKRMITAATGVTFKPAGVSR